MADVVVSSEARDLSRGRFTQVAQIAETFMASFDVDELTRISKCVEMARGRVYRLRDPEAFVHKERVCGLPTQKTADSQATE